MAVPPSVHAGRSSRRRRTALGSCRDWGDGGQLDAGLRPPSDRRRVRASIRERSKQNRKGNPADSNPALQQRAGSRQQQAFVVMAGGRENARWVAHGPLQLFRGSHQYCCALGFALVACTQHSTSRTNAATNGLDICRFTRRPFSSSSIAHTRLPCCQGRGLCPTTQQTGKYFATGLGDGKQLLITLDAGMDKWVPFV